MAKRETSSEIDEAAADWALRIDAAALGEDEQAEFDAWLQGDIRRPGAFLRARAMLDHVKRAKALGPGFAGSLDPDSSGGRRFVSSRRIAFASMAIGIAAVIGMLIPATSGAQVIRDEALFSVAHANLVLFIVEARYVVPC